MLVRLLGELFRRCNLKYQPPRKSYSERVSAVMCSNEPALDCASSLLAANLFRFRTDRFNNVTVDSDDLSCDDATFSTKLKSSLQKWTADGVRAVWFHISLKHSKWLPVLTENDFIFHRVPVSGTSVVMYRWLRTDIPNHVPPYAHTMVGVGGIVLNNKNEILAVEQHYGSRVIWKLPGGYVEPGEDLTEAAVREVEEETGIKTKFQSCVLFRHTHAANFNCSDLYFVLQLEPLNENITEDSDEVVSVRWMAIEEFLNHPQVHDLNRFFVKTYQNYKENNISITKQDALHPVTNKPYTVYFATHDITNSNS